MASAMFHEGDLQSGIAKAVADSKAVLCFVHGMSSHRLPWFPWRKWTDMTDYDLDGSELSQLWEDEYLQVPEV